MSFFLFIQNYCCACCLASSFSFSPFLLFSFSLFLIVSLNQNFLNLFHSPSTSRDLVSPLTSQRSILDPSKFHFEAPAMIGLTINRRLFGMMKVECLAAILPIGHNGATHVSSTTTAPPSMLLLFFLFFSSSFCGTVMKGRT